MLALFIAFPFLIGLFCVFSDKRDFASMRWFACMALLMDTILLGYFYSLGSQVMSQSQGQAWILSYKADWLSYLGITFFLALDGVSLLLCGLTLVVGIVVVLSTPQIRNAGYYYACILWTIGAMFGVFLSLDLFFFYVFWELMIIPMYFLIAFWGHEKAKYAAMKFLIFTQASGLLMLISIVSLVIAHGKLTGNYTFNYLQLLLDSNRIQSELLIMAGFLLAFVVKLGIVPFHGWVRDAYTQAPTGATIVLSAVMAKTAGYGLLRFIFPLFPQAAEQVTTVCFILGVITILYGAVLACSQKNIKTILAYSSMSHMGYLLLGIFSWNSIAMQGTIIQMLGHGLATTALFMIAGIVIQRTNTHDIEHMSGLWLQAPYMAGFALIAGLASMGLPGLGNFTGEIMILVGTMKKSILFASIAVSAMIFSVVYITRMMQKVFQGKSTQPSLTGDLLPHEFALQLVILAFLVWLGFYPQSFLKISDSAVHYMHDQVHHAEAVAVTGFDYNKGVKNSP